jgi:putative thioredoxin
MTPSNSIDVGVENFQEVVLEGSRNAPVVIDFWAPWCAPCRALKPILEKLAHEYAGKFTLVKINSDENQELAAEFGVRGIPAVKAVVDGRLVDEFTGALPESQVREFIERVVPSPSELLRKQARELMGSGADAQALALLDQALALDARNENAKVDKLEALVRLERIDEARALLDSLHPLTLDDPRVAPLKARIEFAAGGAVDADILKARIEKDPADLDARLELARHHARIREFEPALQQLLEIVRRDRKFGDDAGRRTMVEIFNLLGTNHELVSKYRRMLASALY